VKNRWLDSSEIQEGTVKARKQPALEDERRKRKIDRGGKSVFKNEAGEVEKNR